MCASIPQKGIASSAGFLYRLKMDMTNVKAGLVYALTFCALIYSPHPPPQDEINYVSKVMAVKEREADEEVKRVNDWYANMYDQERVRGDAELEDFDNVLECKSIN